MLTLGGTIAVGSQTVTISGTLAFTAFAGAQVGLINAFSMTYSGGTVTGIRYAAQLNGVINSFGGGPNYFPGNAAGTEVTGGRYA